MKYSKATSKKLLKRTILIGVFLLAAVASYAQPRFSLRNNLLYDLTLTPNLSADFQLGHSRWTLGGTVGYNPWWHHGDTRSHAIFRRGDAAGLEEKVQWRHLLIMPEARYWFGKTESQEASADENRSQGPLYRSFFGINAFYSHYNVGNVRFPFGMYKKVRSRRLQGNAYAVGASVGHIWHLAGAFYLEGELGLDVGITKYKEYQCNHCGEKIGEDTKPFLVPKAGLSLVYAPGKKVEPTPTTPITIDIDTTVILPPPPFHPVLAEVKEFGGVADSLMKTHPVLRHKSQYRPYDETRILRKEEGALYVHFPLNKIDLRRDFRDNAEVLDQVVEVTRLIMADTTSSVSCIQIIGLASFEGTLSHNQWLSDGRAKALQYYVQQHVKVPDNLFETIGGGEAWTEFRDQINDIKIEVKKQGQGAKGGLTEAEIDEVLRIIDTEKDLDRREQRIRQMNGGRTFRYLKEHLLADQRNSGYVRIYWDHVPDVKAQLINRASELLRGDNEADHREALNLLRQVTDDPRAYNALGVACYLNGLKDEARQWFQKAADRGNSDAQRNLEAIRHR